MSKKIVAAISAVTRYIQQEEEIIDKPKPLTISNIYSVKFNLWGLSGREAQMQMRNLMQMKAFHRSKFF